MQNRIEAIMKEFTLEKFEEASELVQRVTSETKLVFSEFFSEQSGNKVFFKPENMQYTGAYKVRGAYYKISTLSEEEKVQVLNKCAYCYSYDLQTFYSAIAAICGCISVVVLESGKEKEDYYSVADLENQDGVAYGNTPEEIKRALATCDKLLEKVNFVAHNAREIDIFLALLQAKFN